ncbi:MAG: bifunctional N(6)-L-threonylcarbamoyladenine synthase/serine/threonine protein kinase [Candidatus Altiarchaeota archaeon]
MILGLEGTAHTLGIGIIDKDFNVLVDVRKTYQPTAGIHPRESAQYLGENVRGALDEALSEAKLREGDLKLVAFSQGPGLGPCLRTTATAARVIALKNNIPILGVNHCVAHIAVGKVLSGFKNPLVLYVSGANTQILEKNMGRYRVFGETLDIGIGNMLDKFGRETGLKHPAGPKIEKLASEGKNFIELPYVVKGTDLSFSGVLTAALQDFEKGCKLEDLCYSLQETSFAMLCEVTERALAHLKADEVMLVGGVGYNKRLQEMLSKVSEEHGARFHTPVKYCGDNGVMIAMLGKLAYDAGARMKIDETVAKPNQRTDDIEILW